MVTVDTTADKKRDPVEITAFAAVVKGAIEALLPIIMDPGFKGVKINLLERQDPKMMGVITVSPYQSPYQLQYPAEDITPSARREIERIVIKTLHEQSPGSECRRGKD